MTTSGTDRSRCGNLKIKYVVRLTAEERQELEEVLRRGKAAAQRRRHAQILLKADEGPLGPAWTNERTAEAVGVSAQTVINVRKRLVEDGFEAALGRKKQARPSRAIVLDGEKEARLIALACGKPPAGHARWTLRLLADRLVELQVVESVSPGDGPQGAKKNELQPHRSEYWCIPPEANAEFVCAMENVLETYQLPYDADEPVVCFDERSVQLIGEVTPPLEAEPATASSRDARARRLRVRARGTANVFMFTEPLAGWRHVAVTEHRRRSDLAEQLRWLVDERYPEVRRIKLVCDNLNTHSGACLYEAFAPAEARRILSKLEFVYTPKHGSWLNIAECELSALGRQCLDRRIDSIEALRTETAAWEAERNAAQTGVDWQFTAADARIKLKRLYPKFQS